MAQNQADAGWIYQCDDIVVEPRAHRFERAGVTISVEPKAYAVLVALLQQAGEVVSKNELLDAGWGHRHVTPGVLTRVISQLRHSLGDCAGDPRYIATVHSLGYRFVGDVRRFAAPTTVEAANEASMEERSREVVAEMPSPPPATRPRTEPLLARWLAAAITLAVIVAMLAAVSLWHAPREGMSSPRMSPHPALVLMPVARSPEPHPMHPRHWPRNHRVATEYEAADRDDEPAQAHAAGYLVLRPEQAPAA